MKTFYWYDYETFGLSPKVQRIAQFAGIRTDENLNILAIILGPMGLEGLSENP